MALDTNEATEMSCLCGHGERAHEHYRRGTDCALCAAGECIRFRAAHTPVAAPAPRNAVSQA